MSAGPSSCNLNVDLAAAVCADGDGFLDFFASCSGNGLIRWYRNNRDVPVTFSEVNITTVPGATYLEVIGE